MNATAHAPERKTAARRSLSAIATLAACAFALLPTVLAQAAPPAPQLWQRCDADEAAGQQCSRPGGIAANPDNGRLYVAEQQGGKAAQGSRIVELTAWGEFARTWGWGVVASGPNNDPRNEVQQVSVDATAGDFRISRSFSQTTAPISAAAAAADVQAELEALATTSLGFGVSAEPGDFSVTGPAGGPWAIEFTGANADADIPELTITDSTLTGGTGASVATTQPGANYEVCVPAEGDTCRVGQAAGSAPGQFGWAGAQGVAADSAGDVYVFDQGIGSAPNLRVQKFSPAGEFLLMFGGGVNQGGGTPANPGNVCTAEHLENGDACGAGSQGSDPGEFGDVPGGSYIAVDRQGTATADDDDVWVGDENRIQRFDPFGAYQGEIAIAGTVQSLAVDQSDGSLYAAYGGQVHKLSPAGADLGTIAGAGTNALAVDPDGSLYASDGSTIRTFDSSGTELGSFTGGFDDTRGLAANAVTEAGDVALYVTNSLESNSFVRAYSPVPDPDVAGDPPSVAPTVETTVDTVGTTEATIGADINPRFWEDTSYYAEYGTEDCSIVPNPCTQVGAPGVPLGAGVVDAPQPVSFDLTGLQPGTTYHFRFVAQSGGGGPTIDAGTFRTFAEPDPDSDCPNQAFRANLPSAHLPDCRAYEQVSPPDKGGADVVAPDNVDIFREEEAFFRATPDGGKVSFSSALAFADAEAGPFAINYVASRQGGNWSTHSITPPKGDNLDIETAAYAWNHLWQLSEDLSTAWFYTDADPVLDPAAVPHYRNAYRADTATDTYTPLTTVTPAVWGPYDLEYRPTLAGHSADGEVSVFAANGRLMAAASTATGSYGAAGIIGPIYQLYEHRDGQPLELVSRLPGTNAASGQHSFAGGGPESIEGAVSEDGERIYFTTSDTSPIQNYGLPQADEGIPGKVYLRQSGTTTIPVSDTVAPGGATNARFWQGATDGSAALFTIGTDLYRFQLDPGGGSGSSTQIASDVKGVAGASEDLTRAYFVSTAVLDPGPNSAGDTALAGEQNVYLWEQGEGTTYVATSTSTVTGGFFAFFPIYANGMGGLPDRISRVSPDGSTLLFTAYNSLTDFDNTIDGDSYLEVFRYSASDDELDCVSCNPSGASVLGREDVRAKRSIASIFPGYRQGPFYLQRALSEDGDRAYFESYDRLAAADVNNRLDVYQWQAPGTGEPGKECEEGDASYSDASGGCVDLISTGQSGADSHFIEASAEGSTVFLRTVERLVGSDTDTNFDIYAARVGGGLSAQHPPPAPAPCDGGEGCRGASPATPPSQGAGSAVFEGPGNPKAQSCPKGKRKVTRKGKSRCLARKPRKAKRRGGKARSRASQERRAGR